MTITVSAGDVVVKAICTITAGGKTTTEKVVVVYDNSSG